MNTPHEWIAEASVWWPQIADHLWQATLFGAVVLVASLLLRRAPARIRHCLWLLALAKFIIPAFLLVVLLRMIGVESLWLSLAQSNADPNALLLGFTEPASALSNSYEFTVTATALNHNEIYCGLTLLWLVGCTTLFINRVARRVRFHRALNHGRIVQEGREWLALQRARECLGFRGNVRLVISPQQMEPGVCRVWKPVILMPESIAQHLDDEELDAIMLHELVHVQRRDNLTGTVQLALSTVFWFHPLVWFISRKLFDEREQACDEKVLQIYGAPEAYASSILKVVRFSFGWRVAGVTGAGSGSNLRRRIENIMATGNNKRRVGLAAQVLTGALVGAALIVLIVAGGYKRAQSAVSSPRLNNAPNVAANLASVNLPADVRDEKNQKASRPPQPSQPPQPPQQPSPPQLSSEIQPPAPASPASPVSPAQPVNSSQPAQPPQPPSPPARPSDTQEKSGKPRQEKQELKKGELIEAPRPVYPEEAKKQRIEGTVTVNIVIGEEGNVVSARPISGPELLQGAAKEAALKARFEPTLVDGKPAKVSGAMTYNFVLDENEKNN